APSGTLSRVTGALARSAPSSGMGSNPVRRNGISAESGSSEIEDRSNPFFWNRARYLRPNQAMTRDRMLPTPPILASQDRWLEASSRERAGQVGDPGVPRGQRRQVEPVLDGGQDRRGVVRLAVDGEPVPQGRRDQQRRHPGARASLIGDGVPAGRRRH